MTECYNINDKCTWYYLKGALMFVLFICILILFIKAVCKEPYYDIMTIIGSVAFGSMGYEAHISKNKSKFVIALFFFLFMGYYFYKFLMVGL